MKHKFGLSFVPNALNMQHVWAKCVYTCGQGHRHMCV